jgi:ubiquinone/menaquinone biosynthesis C-methylase UbiE
MVVVTSNQREIIFDAVQAMYTAVATAPRQEFHFPTGRRACELVGYPAAQLDDVLPGALESFAGVGYPFAAAVIRVGDVVLDVGSGSGTDTLIASRLVGSNGRVIALDMTEAMRRKLEANAAAGGATNVRVVAGNAEVIPLPEAAVGVVTTNGVINLVPDKAAAIREMYRVLAPGGRVQLADIVVDIPPSDACRAQPQLWAECIVGATSEVDYVRLFEEAGFRDVEVLTRQDYFAGSSSAETRKVAHSFGAHAFVLRATKPGG